MWFKKASKYRPEKEDRGLINNVTNRSDCPELRAGFKKYFPPYIFQRNNSSHTLTPSNLLVPRKNGQYIVSPKGECWKWAIDGETQRRYFYNKYTREVTWNKPSSLNEWKRFLDTTTNAFYYYSIITRETTWDKPEAFVETRIGTNSVRNDCEGDAQRNSKLETKKPSTISVQSGFKKSSTYSITSPNDCIGRDDHILRNDKYEEVEEREPAEISHSNAKYLVKKLEEDNHPWTPLFDYSSGTYFFHNLDTEAISETKPDEFQEWLSVQSSSKSETYFYNILTGVSTWKRPTSFQQNNKGNNGITRREGKREKLVKLISKYYHGECSYDEKLLHKFEGREHIAIQAIESILEEGETPFDERLLAVSAYVESAVTSMGPEPYDENIDRWRRSVVTPVNKGTSSIQTNHENFAIVKPPNKSPPFDSTTNHISSTSAHSRYLSKPVHLSGSSGRTVLFLYR